MFREYYLEIGSSIHQRIANTPPDVRGQPVMWFAYHDPLLKAEIVANQILIEVSSCFRRVSYSCVTCIVCCVLCYLLAVCRILATGTTSDTRFCSGGGE